MKNIDDYKEKLHTRLAEYMELPVNAHNIEIISDTITCLDCLEDYCKSKETEEKHKDYGKRNEDFTKKTAKRWVDNMENEDGTVGEHWTFEQTESVRKQHGFDCDGVEFYAAINMMYSDYCKVASKYGVNTADFYADLAEAFLCDEDAVEDKIEKYYECIAN